MARAVLVAVLSFLLLGVGASPAGAGNPEFGRTWARDKVLRAGCHDYRYQYKVKPPEGDWALETFLIDPRRKEVGAGQMLFNSDPARGSSTFRICRRTTVPGRFKIKGKLTYAGGDEERWTKPGYFRMRKAS